MFQISICMMKNFKNILNKREERKIKIKSKKILFYSVIHKKLKTKKIKFKLIDI